VRCALSAELVAQDAEGIPHRPIDLAAPVAARFAPWIGDGHLHESIVPPFAGESPAGAGGGKLWRGVAPEDTARGSSRIEHRDTAAR
jgi:hypothetical protein